MKTKVLLAAVAVAFSFAVTSCSNQKSANADSTVADSRCAANSRMRMRLCKESFCCKAADSAICPEGCDSASRQTLRKVVSNSNLV